MKPYVRTKVVKLMDGIKARMRKEMKLKLGRKLTSDEHREIRLSASKEAEDIIRKENL